MGVVLLFALAIPAALFFGVVGVAGASGIALVMTYGVLALMAFRMRGTQRKGARLAGASQGA